MKNNIHRLIEQKKYYKTKQYLYEKISKAKDD